MLGCDKIPYTNTLRDKRLTFSHSFGSWCNDSTGPDVRQEDIMGGGQVPEEAKDSCRSIRKETRLASTHCLLQLVPTC